MAEELLEKIPPEERWEITAKALLTISVLRGVKTVMPLLGMEEGFISPVRGLEKFQEILDKVISEGGKKLAPWVKETFNIPVEDAVGAAKLCLVWWTLSFGPEWEFEIIEATPERVVLRNTKCPWMERYNEFEVDHGHIICPGTHQINAEEGLKAINPKIIYNLVKAMPWEDPYCESIIKFKDE